MVGDGTRTAIDPTSRRSDIVQFIAGTPVNGNLSFGLTPVETSFHTNGNSATLSRSDQGSVIWRVQIMPKNYTAGFTTTSYDFNHDHTIDYLLLTKAGATKLFFVDGRTGQVTKIAGSVAAILRTGMVVQEHDLAGDNAKEFLLSPNRGRTGKISSVDLHAKRVVWTSSDAVCGGMTVRFSGTRVPNRTNKANIALTSIHHSNSGIVLDGASGKQIKFKTITVKQPRNSSPERVQHLGVAARAHPRVVLRLKSAMMKIAGKFIH
jgi:hypothetical protein